MNYETFKISFRQPSVSFHTWVLLFIPSPALLLKSLRIRAFCRKESLYFYASCEWLKDASSATFHKGRLYQKPGPFKPIRVRGKSSRGRKLEGFGEVPDQNRDPGPPNGPELKYLSSLRGSITGANISLADVGTLERTGNFSFWKSGKTKGSSNTETRKNIQTLKKWREYSYFFRVGGAWQAIVQCSLSRIKCISCINCNQRMLGGTEMLERLKKLILGRRNLTINVITR